MKKKWLRFVAVPALAGGMLMAAVPETSTQPNTAVQQRWQKRREAIAKYLNLTEAQKEQAKAELQAARTTARPMRQQLRQVRQEMFQAIRANDTAKIQQLSAQEGNLKGQLTAVRDEAFAKIYSNLTPEQRAKADQLPAHFRQMRQRRMENHQTPNNG
jgi:Spy/CpxP family protein refolding chaperone